MAWLWRFLLLTSLLSAGAAWAVQPDEILSDPALEARARALSHQLRCMVCQNQSIDDSDASLARDLRILVRERLQAGDNDEQVLNFLTARYGDFVLLNPRFTPHTILLWLVPGVALLGGVVVLFALARHQRRSVPQAAGASQPLTPAEQEKLSQLQQTSRK